TCGWCYHQPLLRSPQAVGHKTKQQIEITNLMTLGASLPAVGGCPLVSEIARSQQPCYLTSVRK
ncbi:MAG TPA: hypothetical protein PKA53_13015, partial [Sphingobacterium sp.]|nr:hypothetical protein [Sphingobacterium sp.]